MQVAENRFNIYATVPGVKPHVVFSTHIDTVPPFIASKEDDEKIYGRGACDTKGITGAMLHAATRLLAEKAPIGLLWVVDEERDSLGARVANTSPMNPKAKYLINGEPTENKIAIASKGSLKVIVTARGRMAHSAYPELGDSAIEKLLEALSCIRAVELPVNPEIGPTTMNIGIIEGGRAPNVIPDFARAQILYRLVGPAQQLKKDIEESVGSISGVQVDAEVNNEFIKLRKFEDLPTFVAAYTTDIPALSDWGEPILFGPGSIHVAHTTGEFIAKKELLDAAEIYYRMAKKLIAQ
jgi:acetylornithine deacetylase